MKVLQVMAGGPVGGAETFFVDAIKAIDECGVEQQVVTRGNNAQKVEMIRNLNIPLETSGFHKLWKWPTGRVIRKRIKEFKPDIAHHWLGRAGMYTEAGAHINIGWYGGYYKTKYYKDCQHHIAVTKDVADHIIGQGIQPKSVHVLHIYAEFEKSKPLNRTEFDTPEDVPLLLSLARLHEVKGLDVLINAMQKIPDAYL